MHQFAYFLQQSQGIDDPA